MKGRPMHDFEPFDNETDVISVGGLTIENRVDRVTLQGDVELTKDRRGLALARELKAVIDATLKVLEADEDLPGAVQVDAPTKVENPFG